MSTSISSLDEIMMINKNISKKELEIQKRKELMQQMAQSEAHLLKQQKKESKIDSKIQSQKQQLESKIQYFQSEIRHHEEKMEKIIRDARDQFEKYRSYCHSQISVLEQKYEGIIQGLEGAKEEVPSISDDKILKRLEIEVQQLNEAVKEKRERYFKEQDEQMRAMRRERLLELQMEEDKVRREEERKRELAMQQREIERLEKERKEEQKRDQRKAEIEAIMIKERCDYVKACEIWSLPPIDPEVKERQDVEKIMKQLRISYPFYKSTISELDLPYRRRLARLTEDTLIVEFLEKMKPLIEEKLKLEEDPLFLDDAHNEIYNELPLDTQLQCIKIKDKMKRYKFLDKYKKTRVDRINDELGCL